MPRNGKLIRSADPLTAARRQKNRGRSRARTGPRSARRVLISIPIDRARRTWVPAQNHRFVCRKGVSSRARGRARARRSPRSAPGGPTRRRRRGPKGSERGVKWLTRANRKGGDSRRRKLTSEIARANESSAHEKRIGRAFTNGPFAHHGDERAGCGLAQDASPSPRQCACRGGCNRQAARPPRSATARLGIPGRLAKGGAKAYFPAILRSLSRRSSGVEQRIRNAWAGGSNPSAGTISFGQN